MVREAGAVGEAWLVRALLVNVQKPMAPLLRVFVSNLGHRGSTLEIPIYVFSKVPIPTGANY
jgi:hypothetical protein